MPQRRISYRFVGPARDFTLKPGINVVGRYLYCQVHLDSPDVAGEHASVELSDNDTVSITPIHDSLVYVNGKPIKGRTDLKPGDNVQVGDVSLSFLERQPTVSISVAKRLARRQSIIRRFLLAVVILLSAGGALYGFARILVSPSLISAQLAEYLSLHLHRDVEVKGVSVNLVERRAFCERVTIKDTADFQMATAAEFTGVHVHVDSPAAYILPFLGKPCFTVSVEKADVTVRMSAAGKSSVDDLLARIYDLVQRPGRATPALSVTVKQGTVRYEAADGKMLLPAIRRLDLSCDSDVLMLEWDLADPKGLHFKGHAGRTKDGVGVVDADLVAIPRWAVHTGRLPFDLDWAEISLSGSVKSGLPVAPGAPQPAAGAVLGHAALSGTAKAVVVRTGGVQRALGDLDFSLLGDYDKDNGVIKGTAGVSGKAVSARTTIDADLANQFVSGQASAKVVLDNAGDFSVSLDEAFSLHTGLVDVAGTIIVEKNTGETLLALSHDLEVGKGKVVAKRLEGSGLISFKFPPTPVVLPFKAGEKLDISFRDFDVAKLHLLAGPFKDLLPPAPAPLSSGTLTLTGTPDLAMACKIVSGQAWRFSASYNRYKNEAGLSWADTRESFSITYKHLQDGYDVLAEGTTDVARLVRLASFFLGASPQALLTGAGTAELTLAKVSARDDATTVAAGGRLKASNLKFGNLWPDPLNGSAPFVFNATFPRDMAGIVTVSSLRWEGTEFKVDGRGAFDIAQRRPVELAGSLACDLTAAPALSAWISRTLNIPLTRGHLAIEITKSQVAPGLLGVSGSLFLGQSSITLALGFRDIASLLAGVPSHWSLAGSLLGQDLPSKGRFGDIVSIDGSLDISLQGAAGEPVQVSGKADFSKAAVILGPFRKNAGVTAITDVTLRRPDDAQNLPQPGARSVLHLKGIVGAPESGAIRGDFDLALDQGSVSVLPGGTISGDAGFIEAVFPEVADSLRLEAGTYDATWSKPWTLFPPPPFWTSIAAFSGSISFKDIAASVAVPGYGWQTFVLGGKIAGDSGKLDGEATRLEAPGIKSGTCSFTLVTSPDGKAVLNSLRITVHELTDILQLVGFAKAWHDGGAMTGPVEITGQGFATLIPGFEQISLLVGDKADWGLTASGILGQLSGRMSATSDGVILVVGRFAPVSPDTLQKLLPGWPFSPIGLIDLDVRIDKSARCTTRFMMTAPTAAAPLLTALSVEEPDAWKPSSAGAYVEYLENKPVAISAAFSRDAGGQASLSGGPDTKGVFLFRRIYPDGTRKDLSFHWDGGWKKKKDTAIISTKDQ